MKKNVVMIVVFTLLSVFMLTGCKKTVGTPEDNAVVEEEETQEEESAITFGISLIDMNNPYFITLEKSLKVTLEENGCDWITMDPASNPEEQAKQIDEMIEKGISGIFLCPVDWEKITPSLMKLQEAGIKIINVDSQVKEMDYIDAYIGSDNKKAGAICGESLVERKPEGGKVLILECPTQNSITERITGFEEVIASAKNGFEVVARVDTNGEFSVAVDKTKEILQEYPDIDVIMCGNDQIAVGAKTAVNVLNMKNIIIYGVDGSPDIKKELKKADNQIAGTAAQSPINIGKTAALIAMQIINGEEYEQTTLEDVFMIDVKNVDMYGVDGWQ